MRDSHGVAQVRFVTGNKILRILKAKGLAPAIPEDLYHLIKKAVSIRKHLERNRKVQYNIQILLNYYGQSCYIAYLCVLQRQHLFQCLPYIVVYKEHLSVCDTCFVQSITVYVSGARLWYNLALNLSLFILLFHNILH